MSRTPIIGAPCIINLSFGVRLTGKEQNIIKYNEKNIYTCTDFFEKVKLSE